jgi:hypothetical protein
LASDRQHITFGFNNVNWVEPYDPTREPRPQTPMNHPAAVQAERKIVILNDDMEEKIERHEYKGADKEELLRVIRKWKSVPFDKIQFIICAVGAAGTGKSTALNHILHAELSRTVSFYFLSKLCS